MNHSLFGRSRAPDISSSPAGIPPDTRVLTGDGGLPAGHLTPGDRIITRNAGYAILRRIVHTRIETRVIRLRAGALGHKRPETDLILPAGQPVLVRDWRAPALFGRRAAMVPVCALLDGEFVTDPGRRTLVLCRLHLDGNHVIYAGGLELGCAAIEVRGDALT